MTFNSYSFIFIFLPVFLAGVWVIQSFYPENGFKEKLMKIWLIAMSAFFFVGYGQFSVLIFGSSILGNFLFLFRISRRLKKCNGNTDDWLIRLYKISAIILNVILLCFFKYFGTGAMPVAISFYTFSQIMYVADLGKEDSFDALDYLSYITFFPKILQGPIADHKSIKEGLEKLPSGRINSDDISAGIMLFTLGLFKKVILAQVLGEAVDYGYAGLAGMTALDAVILAVSYSFQLYFDFSGYCDMAEGICRMLGMELQMNFDAPYTSGNIAEFWDRWHISLTKFFTRYIYIPLGGSRKGVVRTYLNILIVFFISGIWHGTGLTFIVWGMMHGVLMVLTRICGKKAGSGRKNPLKVLLTFMYVTAAWVFFRAPSLSDAMTLLCKIVNPDAWSGLHISIKFAECFMVDEIWYVFKVTPIPNWNKSNYICMWIILCVSALLVFWGKTAKKIAAGSANVITSEDDKNKMKKWAVSVAYGILFVWCVLSLGGVSTFLYVNF
ncbi:MBOAT family O-acyltransferase [Butyrivibrio sp. FC2001]|uniref:MBOAT family O-acyltransferase n=1 Tax=Butyrivibrio sp. FC2001 TaxID=1280671 RepID=UPI00040F264E|nr:MBOAT family O-acyltransferase [Butyrivibrio sp. FC2001]